MNGYDGVGYLGPPDQSAGEWQVGVGEDDQTLAGGPQAAGSPALGLASLILVLIGLKFFTESDLLTTDLAEVKVSLLNLFSVGFMSIVGILLIKALTAGMAARGVALPGQVALVSAI